MLIDAASLPDDIEELRSIIVTQAAELHSRDLLIERMKLQLARLKRLQFGRSSERILREIAQLELALEEAETESAARSAPASSSPSPTSAKPVRRPLPEHLPRDEVVHEPASGCTCPRCGGALRRMGEDVTESLEYVPASFRVIRHVRPKLSCRSCEAIVQAPAPSMPIERGRPGPGLLAHVLVAKYADHLPLYRQSEIYAREGVDLCRSTLADWVGKSAALLQPLVDALGRHVMGGATLHADDTPVPVLAPGAGRTKTGRLWTYVRDERGHGGEAAPAVLFRYTPDRRGEHPRTHLAGFAGHLHADGYAGFDKLYAAARIPTPLVEVACMAHARRKFFDIHAATGSAVAGEALARIGRLYEVEASLRGRPPDERLAGRRARAGPLLIDLKLWLETMLPKLSRRSDLAVACRYALVRWQALTAYAGDGRLEIDNSAAERALRGVALGRKIGSSPAPTRAGSAPPPSTASSKPPSSAVATPRPTCVTSSTASPTTRHAASTSCCLGTSAPDRRRHRTLTVPERDPVSLAAARPSRAGSLAMRLQRAPSAQFPRRPNPDGTRFLSGQACLP